MHGLVHGLLVWFCNFRQKLFRASSYILVQVAPCSKLYVVFKIKHPTYLCSTGNTNYTISKGKEIIFKAKTLAHTCWKRGQWILYNLQSRHNHICWHPRHLTEQSNHKIVHLQISWAILEQRDKILPRVTYQKANQPKVQFMHVEIKIWKTKEKNMENFTRDPICWCKLSSRHTVIFEQG
jgi:hypothetical protein